MATHKEYRTLIEECVKNSGLSDTQIITLDYITPRYLVSYDKFTIEISERSDGTVRTTTNYAFATGRGFRQPTTILQKTVLFPALKLQLSNSLETILTGEIQEDVAATQEYSGYPAETVAV